MEKIDVIAQRVKRSFDLDLTYTRSNDGQHYLMHLKSRDGSVNRQIMMRTDVILSDSFTHRMSAYISRAVVRSVMVDHVAESVVL